MKTLYYEQVNGIYPDRILEDVDKHKPDRVVIFGQTEWEIPDITKKFVFMMRHKKVELKVVHGSGYHEYYKNLYESIGLPIENVIFWPHFWLKYTYTSLCHSGYRPEQYVVDYRKIKNRFISLNNRSHLHRCVFMDELAKQHLLDQGIVTWVKHLNENKDYPYKYFDNRQILLDDDFATKLDSFLIPKEFHESCVHVVAEATTTVNIISEKTWIPLLLKKPFLVLGGKGFNRELASLGFKLYDQVFDYSFDDIDDIYLRTEKFVDNVLKLKTHDPAMLYKILEETTLYNYNHAVQLINDDSSIPEIAMDYYHLNKTFKHGASDLATTIDHFLRHKPKVLKLYSIWHDNPNYLNEIDGDKVYQVLVDNTVEVAYNQLQGDPEGLSKLIHQCRAHKIPITLFSCCYKHNTYLDEETAGYLTVVDDDKYWIAKHLHSMLAYNEYQANKNLGYDIFDNDVGLATDVKHLYITMNNLAKRHRSRMMDMLAKYNLIDLGAIAWRNSARGVEDESNYTDNPYDYPYEYWVPKRMYLDFEDNKTSFVNQNIMPSQYKNSFMQLVAESEDIDFILSEKTAVPLLMNKPFLVVGCKHFHKKLQDMGFVLFDEIFDYSFDDLDDITERTELLVKNIDNLKNKTVDELNELTRLIRPKLEHNRKLALHYVKKTIDIFRPYVLMLDNIGAETQLKLIDQLELYADRF